MVLEFIDGDRKGEKFQLKDGEITIGRKDFNAIILDDEKASSKHLKITTKGKKVVLVDLGSSNGTFLNGSRIEANENIELDQGDRIVVGTHVFELRSG